MNSHISKLRALLKEQTLDAALISSAQNIIYLTDFSHFYNKEREAFLLITQKNNYIFTDKRYTHAVQTHIKDFILLEIFYGHKFSELLKKVIDDEKIASLGIEEDDITYREYRKIAPAIQKLTHFDLSPLRIYKTAREIKLIQKACEISDSTFLHILNHVKDGITEKEVALEMEQFMKKNGAEVGFETIIAFEENAAFIHHQTGNRKLKKGDVILMDFGAQYQNYVADISRTIIFGKATSEKKKAYVTVLDAQEKATSFIEAKLATNDVVLGSEVDKVARDHIITRGYDSFSHGLGHGIGLQVHESPSLRPPSTSILKPGMVFTNEPGIYLPHKFGIRIEDDFTIQNNTLVQLTQSPRELIEL